MAETARSAGKQPEPDSGQTVVCILGMHRSGTSLIARLANVLGLDLGPNKRIYGPMRDNPTGMWEYRPFVRINRKLLHRRKGSWYFPPPSEGPWLGSGNLLDLRLRAHASIVRDFRSAPLWGWKDPRTCLTLPFWQDLVGPMSYVICTRNPVDVARSLERRNQLPFKRALDLWSLYTELSLQGSKGAKRTFVDYEEVVRDPVAAMKPIADLLGTTERLSERETRAEMEAFRDPKLQHSATSERELMQADEIPPTVKRLYSEIRELTPQPVRLDADQQSTRRLTHEALP